MRGGSASLWRPECVPEPVPCEPLGSERRSGGVFRAGAPEGTQGQAADP